MLHYERILISYFRKHTWENLQRRTVNSSYRNRNPNRRNQCYLDAGVELRFTRSEWDDWVGANAPTILAIFKAGGRPSLDRLGKHYEVGAIRVLDLRDNMKRGVNGKRKPVLATCITSGKVTHFESVREVVRHGFTLTCVRNCLAKKKSYLTYRGHTWEYASGPAPLQDQAQY